MNEKAPIHPAFAPHLLNPQGVEKTNRIHWSFSVLLSRLEEDMPAGRELAIVRTKLEEACMFALRGVALAAENQATAQPGRVESYEATLDHYDAELTGVRVLLTEAGIPEAQEGKALSQVERLRILTGAHCSPRPMAAGTAATARRLYQVYAQHADWKDYRGEPLPTFDEMRESTKAHWLHVAEDLAIYGSSADKNAQRIAESSRP